MKKSIIWGVILAICVAFAAPVQAQLAKRTDLDMKDITAEINKLAQKGDAESKAQMAKEALAFSKTNNEQYRMLAVSIYRFVGDTEAADKVNEGILKKFPKGIKARGEALTAILGNKESSALEKEVAYQAWLKKFPSASFDENNQSIYTQAATSLGRELINENHFDHLGALIEGTAGASGTNYTLISSFASELVKKEKYGEALRLLEPAYQQIGKEENELGIHRTVTGQYANALIESGQAEKGIALIEGMAATNPSAAASVSNTIALSKGYAKTGRTFDAFHTLESYLLNREVSGQVIDEMKGLYSTMNNGKGDFTAYKADLDKKILTSLKEKHKASMVKNEAPGFRLRNMKGDFVSLEDMKGKIVVLDFWATWCGPCIVSFPGMQLAVNKYADDPEVEFLFIDTWQSEENYVELVTNFIAENKYTFHVLYDEMKERDKATVTAYGVRGIPTKVFIDKEGFIRFQSAGGYSDAELVMTEVVAKIELIREAQGD